PVRVGGEAGHEVDHLGLVGRGQSGSGFVDLGGRAVRFRDGDVGADGSACGNRVMRQTDGVEAGEHGVIAVSGQHGSGRPTGAGDGAGDVDSLPAGLLAGPDGSLHLASEHRTAEFDGPVQARVRCPGEDPGVRTSTSAFVRWVARGGRGMASVMRWSMRSRAANLTSETAPNFAAAARTATRRPLRTNAVFVAASS